MKKMILLAISLSSLFAYAGSVIENKTGGGTVTVFSNIRASIKYNFKLGFLKNYCTLISAPKDLVLISRNMQDPIYDKVTANPVMRVDMQRTVEQYKTELGFSAERTYLALTSTDQQTAGFRLSVQCEGRQTNQSIIEALQKIGIVVEI